MNKRISVSVLIACALFLLAGIPYSGADAPGGIEFRAGAGSVNITPIKHVPLNGYGARKKAPATGMHDPLYAKALVVESLDASTGAVRKAAIVTTDLCMMNPAMRKSVLGQIGDLGINDANFIMTASHTHSGPAALDPRAPFEMVMGKFDPVLFTQTNEGIAKAVRQANGRLAPAKLGVSQQEFPDLVRNRRVAGYSYETRRFSPDAVTKPADAMMSVLRIDGTDGSPIAVLVVIGSHPTILGPDNMLISADWPGVTQRELEKSIGGNVVAMFANGADGDQAPPSFDGGDDFYWMNWYGWKVAQAAAGLWEDTEIVSDVPIRAAVFDGKLPRMHLRGFMGMPLPKTLTRGIASNAKCGAMRIGPAVLVGLPGEPVHNVVMDVRRQAIAMGVKNPVVIGLANDWIGYIADPETYREGGYEAGMTMFGEKEAAVISESAINALKQLFSSP